MLCNFTATNRDYVVYLSFFFDLEAEIPTYYSLAMDHPIRCFLIDDDLDDQEIFFMALQDAYDTISCVCANDGVQALEKLNTDQAFVPHFIFIDMNMPRMKGVQCLEEIKKIDRLRDIPVYMYSTSADPTAIAQTKQLGAADFIVKPSTIGALTSTLSKLLQN